MITCSSQFLLCLSSKAQLCGQRNPVQQCEEGGGTGSGAESDLSGLYPNSASNPDRQQDVPGDTDFLCPLPVRVLLLGWGLGALLKAASVWAH